METVFVHLLTEHLERVNNLCQLCNERVKRKEKDSYKNIKLRANYVYELSPYRNINIAEDEDVKHSFFSFITIDSQWCKH